MEQLFVVGLFVTLVNQVCAHAGRQRNSTIANFMVKRPIGRALSISEVRRDAERENHRKSFSD